MCCSKNLLVISLVSSCVLLRLPFFSRKTPTCLQNPPTNHWVVLKHEKVRCKLGMEFAFKVKVASYPWSQHASKGVAFILKVNCLHFWRASWQSAKARRCSVQRHISLCDRFHPSDRGSPEWVTDCSLIMRDWNFSSWFHSDFQQPLTTGECFFPLATDSHQPDSRPV